MKLIENRNKLFESTTIRITEESFDRNQISLSKLPMIFELEDS